MDLDDLLDGLDTEDVEDLFNRLRKRARAKADVMKRVATKLVMGTRGPTGEVKGSLILATPPGALGYGIARKGVKEQEERNKLLGAIKYPPTWAKSEEARKEIRRSFLLGR